MICLSHRSNAKIYICCFSDTKLLNQHLPFKYDDRSFNVENLKLLVQDSYVIRYSIQRKTPLFTAERLDGSALRSVKKPLKLVCIYYDHPHRQQQQERIVSDLILDLKKKLESIPICIQKLVLPEDIMFPQVNWYCMRVALMTTRQ